MDNLIGRQPYNGLVGKEFLADKGKKAVPEEEKPQVQGSEQKIINNSQAIQGELDAQANINKGLLGVHGFISQNKPVDFANMSDEELLNFATKKLGAERTSDIEKAVNGFEDGVNKVVGQIKADSELSEFSLTNAQIYAAAAKAFAQ